MCSSDLNALLVPSRHLIAGVVEQSHRLEFADSRRDHLLSPIGVVTRAAEWLPAADGTFRRPAELAVADLPSSFQRDDVLADALEMTPVRLFAEGVVRLSESSNAEVQAVYRLAFLGPDGQLIEVEGLYSSFSVATQSALLQNVVRRNAGESEFTHLVEYIRTSSFACRR